MDKNAAIRSIPFLVVAHALGISLEKFKKKGHDWVGPCPIHGSKNNVGCFRYHEDGRYNCFSEGCKGKGALDLAKAVKNIGFQAAVELLTPLVGKEPANEKSLVVEAPIASGELKPFTGKYHLHQAECEWLNQRCPDKAVRERYGVIYYSNPSRNSNVNNHVLIPIKDVDGTQYGWLARNIGEVTAERPKYRMPPIPKSKFLFGAAELKQHLLSLGTGRSTFQQIYLVESPFCCLKFASMGLPAVSCYGWSVSSEQSAILRQLARGVCYLPDRNKTEEALHVAGKLAREMSVRFPPLPAGVDDPEQLGLQDIQALTR